MTPEGFGGLLGSLTASIFIGYILYNIFVWWPRSIFVKEPKYKKTKLYYFAATIKYLIIGILFTQIEYIRVYPVWIAIWIISIILLVLGWKKLKSLNLLYHKP